MAASLEVVSAALSDYILEGGDKPPLIALLRETLAGLEGASDADLEEEDRGGQA